MLNVVQLQLRVAILFFLNKIKYLFFVLQTLESAFFSAIPFTFPFLLTGESAFRP